MGIRRKSAGTSSDGANTQDGAGGSNDDDGDVADGLKKSPGSAPNGVRQRIMGLDEKYGIFKLAKFGIASVTGFLVSELLLTLGVLLLFGKLSPPSDAYSSPVFLGLDVGVLAFGVFVAFLVNERFTVKVELANQDEATRSRAARLLKFEGANAMGNATVIGVQFALFAALSVAPVIGSIAGSILSYPITYLISMRVVWNPPANVPMDESLTNHRDQPPKKGGTLAPPFAAIGLLISLYALGQVLRRRKR